MSKTYPTIIPTLLYKDAHAAVDWLCQTFGFTKKVVFEAADGTVANAQLTFGNGMIMLSTRRVVGFGQFIKTPHEMDGFNCMTPFIIVEQIDEHYQKAVAAGAEIIMELETVDTRKGYTCRDLEGYIWSFGNYNPWSI